MLVEFVTTEPQWELGPLLHVTDNYGVSGTMRKTDESLILTWVRHGGRKKSIFKSGSHIMLQKVSQLINLSMYLLS